MANMIFDERDDSINEHRDSNVDLVVVNDDNIMEPNPTIVINELNQQMEGITAALEDIGTLNKIKETLQNRPKSKSSIKIGQLAMENIKRRLNVFELTGVSTEAVDNSGKDEQTIAIEGISDFITKIFKMIANTIRAILNAIKSGIVYLLGKRKNENFESLLEEIEDAAKKGTHALIPKEQLSLALEKLSRKHSSFKHYDSTLTPEKLHKGLDLLTNGIQNIGDLVTPFADSVEMASRALISLNNNSREDDDKNINEIVEAINKKYDRIKEVLRVDSSFKPLVDRYSDVDVTKRAGYDFRPVGVFNNNELFFYYSLRDDSNKLMNEFFFLSSIKLNDSEVKVLPLDLNHLSSYMKSMNKVYEASTELSHLVGRSMKSIETVQRKAADVLENVRVNDDGSRLIDFVVEQKSLINQLLKTTTQIWAMTLSSAKELNNHASLGQDLFMLYKPKQ
jgi:uncharacterized protein YukE